MNRIRPLPQRADDTIFLTDGGLETTLVFHEGLTLPCFASFPLLSDNEGRARLERYYEPYLRSAIERKVGFILDTPTWRANADWGAKIGYDALALADLNRDAVIWAQGLRERFEAKTTPILIDGAIGPRGDGYRPDRRMTAAEAESYHQVQIAAFADADADMVTAYTINYAAEAIGIAKAAKGHGLPVAISFTVETDGKLASGETLQEAIEKTDQATGAFPAYYMINCAHPSHFESVLSSGTGWTDRIRGLRANASSKSHAELDESDTLDIGDPPALGRHYRALRERFTQLNVLGGCCGTDHRHIVAICDACLPSR